MKKKMSESRRRCCCPSHGLQASRFAQWISISFLILGLFMPVVVADSKSLKILVPVKLGFREFVAWVSTETPLTNATISFSGFSIEVFERCLTMLGLNSTFIGYGDGISEPIYDDILQALVDSEDVDGVVADLTITKDRWEKVDFTQPYVQSSLRMVVPLSGSRSSNEFWIFLMPFSTKLWAAIVVLFFVTMVFLFVIEVKGNCNRHGETTDKKPSFQDILWFTTMAVFFSQREEVKSRVGRLLTVLWLVAVLIFTSSYTASLSSMLAAQQPNPTIASFVDLQKSHLRVGSQGGSFVANYMINNLFIVPQRLVTLASEEDYDQALKSGNVSAIVDESPYLETFLTTYGCRYTNVDADIAYFSGFGFAFKKNSSLTNKFSLAIIALEQNGDLQSIKDKWLGSGKCINATATTNISFSSFGGLFIILSILYIICLIFRLFWRIHRREESSGTGCNLMTLTSLRRRFSMLFSLSWTQRGTAPLQNGEEFTILADDTAIVADGAAIVADDAASLQLSSRTSHPHPYDLVPSESQVL